MNIALACLCAVAILVLLPTKVEAPRSGWYRPAPQPAAIRFSCLEQERMARACTRMDKVKANKGVF